MTAEGFRLHGLSQIAVLEALAELGPTVEELAAACGLGVRTFQNLFRESKKCSVAEYIRSAQIATAKTYLLDTDLPIKEIAYRLRFSSPANFTTAIRTATGKTPRQIRKTQQ